jgi:hypothetical protein
MAKRAGSTVVEAKGSQAIYFSQPQAVAALIEQAASKTRGLLSLSKTPSINHSGPKAYISSPSLPKQRKQCFAFFTGDSSHD